MGQDLLIGIAGPGHPNGPGLAHTHSVTVSVTPDGYLHQRVIFAPFNFQIKPGAG